MLESNSRMVLPYRRRREVGEIWAAQGLYMAWGSAGPASQAMESMARKAEVLLLEPPRRKVPAAVLAVAATYLGSGRSDITPVLHSPPWRTRQEEREV